MDSLDVEVLSELETLRTVAKDDFFEVSHIKI